MDKPARVTSPLQSLARPPVFITLVIVYFMFTAALIGYVMPSGHSDDAEVMLLSQSFEWGYEPKNPPLFNWGAWLGTAALTASPEVIFIQRTMWRALMVIACFLVARRLQPDPLLAAAAGLAPLATLHLHWYAFFDLTHSIAAAAFYPLTVLVVIHVHRRRTLGSFLLLGMTVGLGMLTKYVFTLFLVALLGATLANSRLRHLVLDRRILAAVALATVIDLPHAGWLLAHVDAVSSQSVTSLALTLDGNYWPGVMTGLTTVAEGILSILLFPFGLMYLAFLRSDACPGEAMDPDRRAYLKLLRDLFIGLALLFVLVILAGATHVRPHHMFSLALVPLWLIGRLDGGRVRRWGPPAFLYGVAAWLIFTAVAFLPANIDDARTCRRSCEEFLPMAAYAETLRAAGFTGGTIVSLSRRQHLPGAMLRAYFPAARIVSPHYPTYDPPAPSTPGSCLLVWARQDDADIGTPLREGGEIPRIGGRLPENTVFGEAEGTLHLAARPAPVLSFALVPQGLPSCR